MAYCPSCAQEISGTALTCSKCGADFSAKEGWKPVDVNPRIPKPAPPLTIAATWKRFGMGCFLWGIFLLPLSGFMFDAPGSEKSMPTLTLAWSIWSYPVVHLIAVAGSRLALAQGAPERAVRFLAYLPLINVAWFVAGIVWIELQCDGKFNCR